MDSDIDDFAIIRDMHARGPDLGAPRERAAGTLAAIGAGVDAGAAILRVHDVAATVDYLKVRAALAGEVPVDPQLRLPDSLRRQRAA